MEKSVKNAVFKGFPVLMESGPFGSKQYSQTTNKETNNSLSSFFKVYYLVSKCMSERVADQSAIGPPMAFVALFGLFLKHPEAYTQVLKSHDSSDNFMKMC